MAENMNISDFRNSELSMLFNSALTENGDDAVVSSGNKLIDLLFKAEYYTQYPGQAHIGTSALEKLFAMFIRDPRYGLGYKTYGRKLMAMAGLKPQQVVLAGSYKDFRECSDFYNGDFKTWQSFMKDEIAKGNELAKKWAPRYSSANMMLARNLAKAWGMNKQQYGHFVKSNTVEQKLSRHKTEEINFSHVPSNAMLKYYNRFATGKDTAARFQEYLESVKKGKAKINVSVTTVYDIYKKSFDTTFDADLFFEKMEKISGSWIPIVDTSGSMFNENDSVGKAMSIGHYLAKCSTYCPNQVLSFSNRPQLITLGSDDAKIVYRNGLRNLPQAQSVYGKEIRSMFTGDCENTDFGAVMKVLGGLEKELPEWLVVLSDMQFDEGSCESKDELMKKWKEKGITTKIVWWNFNSRNTTMPETDKHGNIFLTGYNPMLLKYLACGFNAEEFLMKLLIEYERKIASAQNC